MDRRTIAYAVAALVLGFTARRAACAGESAAVAAADAGAPPTVARPALPDFARDATWTEGAPPETMVQDAAEACGVLAIPRSPAEISVALDGGVANVAIESDLFGGPDAEACVTARLRAHGRAPGQRARTVRYALETFFPERLARPPSAVSVARDVEIS